jgi:hypothetical protein
VSEQAILTAARAYVQALEKLAAARKARRNCSESQWLEWRELVAHGHEKSIPFSLD